MELFERPGLKTGEGERAILLHVRARSDESPEALGEFVELAQSAGAVIDAVLVVTRTQFDARTLIGSGKVEEIRSEVEAREAGLVIVNHDLSPSQERNLEKILGCRVLDRAGLILDIFAQRARSHEGKLQVELAQLQHLSTRLVRGWTHLERQKGGIGLRGPGETQLETDRRLVAVRINQLKKRLEKVRSQRQEGRKGRQRADIPTVALVGYTNAGKSTLFNRLTEAGVYAADQLFATLDATLRRVDMPQGAGAMVLADTVGFIADLPHELVAAFRSTLEETREASLLLHVIDAQAEGRDERIAEVENVLGQIGADDVPQLQVYNKIDLVGLMPRIDYDDEGRPRRVWISAEKGLGIGLLFQAIEACLAEEIVSLDLDLEPSEARLRARLYEEGAITAERLDDEGHWHLGLRLPAVRWSQLLAHEPTLKSAVDRGLSLPSHLPSP